MRGRMRQHHAIRLRRARASPAESAALWDDGPSSQERNSSSVRSRLRRRCGIVELNRQAGHFHRWTPLPVRPFFFIARPHTGHLFALLDGVLTPSSPPPGAHHFPRDKNDRPTRLLPQGRATVISTTKVPIGHSFKKRVYISKDVFSLPTGDTFVGLENYERGIEKTNILPSFGWTIILTLGSVALILLCCSMCAWWIVRVNNWVAKLMYLAFIASMVVPFQMVMFPLSKLTDTLDLNTPWGMWLVYLGFGAGLPVFIFTGVIKSIPSEIEEAAMIDGAGSIRTFFTIVLPMMRPALISVAILETMWVWNDFLMAYLCLDLQRFKTLSIAIQYLKGGYGSVDMGAMMGALVLALLPILVFYLCGQKYIIKGVTAGAVKG